LAAAKLAHPHSEPAWRAQVAAGMLFNPLGRQRDLTQPTLVMQGTADQVVDPSNADVLELLDRVGHLLYWEQPRRFARVVAGFLNEPATSTRRLTRPVRRAS
jgi:pimeloyl-ACP methyl ester carboxylesterase